MWPKHLLVSRIMLTSVILKVPFILQVYQSFIDELSQNEAISVNSICASTVTQGGVLETRSEVAEVTNYLGTTSKKKE